MLSILKNMNLSHKVMLFIAFLVTAFLVIIWQFQAGQAVLDAAAAEELRIRSIGDQLQVIESVGLDSRKVEKEFLMDANLQAVDQHKKNMNQMRVVVSKLSAAFVQEKERKLLDRLKLSLAEYESNFNAVVDFRIEIGLDESSGLLAKLKRAVKKVERVIRGSNDQNLMSRMLLIRQSEMEFIVRKDDKYLRRLERDLEMFRNEITEAEISDRYVRRITEGIDKYHKIFLEVSAAINSIKGRSVEFNVAANAMTPVLNDLKRYGEVLLEGNRQVVAESRASVERQFNLILVFVAAIACGVLWLSARSLIKGIGSAASVGLRVAEGDLDTEIDVTSNDEIGSLLQTLGSMQRQLKERIERDRKIANEALRIKTALDNASTSMMVVDNDYKIIYLNQSADTLFQKVEADIAEEIPEFSANSMMGACMDQFHKNPDHQRDILDRLEKSHNARIQLAGNVFDLKLNAVLNREGQRLGIAMEWDDVTGQVNAEREIDQTVAFVAEGDLEKRIELEGKEGFYHSLGSSINELTSTVEESLSEVEDVLSGLADGELLKRVSEGKQGAFGRLGSNVNQTSERLLDTVTGIREVAGAISSSSGEIASGNNNLSRLTESQAASLEETASTMEEFTSTVRNNADSAQEANKLAADARSLAEKGGEVVGQAVGAMTQITESADKIADIIGVIDEIAFQTNLLALNASVEAARAGVHGRGFAVVATEVRNLAQRSALAAKEIKGLIMDSGERVQAGTARVNESGETLKDIVESIQKVGGIVSEIAAASREQAIGIDQVNRAVADMDGAIQQNAALAEETSAASQAMDDQATQLNQLVDFFHTE